MFAPCAQLQEQQFYELTGEFGLGKDGKSIDSRRWEVRALNEDELVQVLEGSDELRSKQDADYQFDRKSGRDPARLRSPRKNMRPYGREGARYC